MVGLPGISQDREGTGRDCPILAPLLGYNYEVRQHEALQPNPRYVYPVLLHPQFPPLSSYPNRYLEAPRSSPSYPLHRITGSNYISPQIPF